MSAQHSAGPVAENPPQVEDGTAAVRLLLAPRSIAVVGASRNRHAVGGQLFHNLITSDFRGRIYPVNPSSPSIQGVRAYPSVLEIDDEIDLVLIALPAESVNAAARECASKGVQTLVVVSAGFAETGSSGAQRQDELLSICRAAGMRLVGPNCMGVANTAADVKMNAQFAPIAPSAGRIGVVSQSGALGLALIHQAAQTGLGLSSFVSLGNQADLSTDDFLSYWQTDEGTDAVLLYLETINDPRRFARIARQVAHSKPIIAVKSGRTTAGARATSSHTGALLGASDVTVDALFHQAGVVRTDTLAEMFEVAALLAAQPLPAGRRVAIISNGGGPGILAADACEAAGLVVPPLDKDVCAQLGGTLPATAGVGNPIDMIASATPADYARAMELVAADPGIDAMIVISGPPLATPTAELAAAIRTASGRLRRPMTTLAVFMSTEQPRASLTADGITVPSYLYPENAAYALAHAVRYAEWRATPTGTVVGSIGVGCADAEAILNEAVANSGSRWLAPAEVRALLECYGLPLVAQQEVETSSEAAAAARQFGGPVALKAVAPGVVHKSEAHGVRLNVSEEEVVAAAADMIAAYALSGAAVVGFVVQPMVPTGVEMLVGVVHDPLFGPVVACAAGGTQAELLRDVAVRIAPLSDADAAEMIRSLATFPLLDGFRGAAKVDVAALEDVLMRVGAMVDAHPQIAEMDLNPVIVLEHGAVVVDARIRVEPLAGRPDSR